MEKYEITYDEFDELCEEVTEYDFIRKKWLPTLEEIDYYIKPNPKEFITFIVWIIENSEVEKTQENKGILFELNNILKENIRFI